MDGLDERLRSALAPTATPGERLNQNVKWMLKERANMHKKKKTRLTVALVAALTIVMLGATAFAAIRLLSPKEFVEEIGYPLLAQAFESDNAIKINEVQQGGGYKATLHGIVSGAGLAGVDDNVQEGRTYAVVTIEKLDGTPMPAMDDMSADNFFVSPLIKGLEPWKVNTASMDGGWSGKMIDGVLYRLAECDNVEMFADKGLYLCVSNTTFFDVNAYTYDNATGVIARDDSFTGLNALFTLPIDPAKGDSAKAEAYLDELFAPDPEPEQPVETPTPIENGVIDEASRKTLTPTADGFLEYVYEAANGSGGNIEISIENYFGGIEGAFAMCVNAYVEDDTMTEVWIARDENGAYSGYLVTPAQ
jgi:hypothetical protein